MAVRAVTSLVAGSTRARAPVGAAATAPSPLPRTATTRHGRDDDGDGGDGGKQAPASTGGGRGGKSQSRSGGSHELGAAFEPILAGLRHRPLKDGVDRLRQVRAALARPRSGLLEVREECRHLGALLVRDRPGQAFEHQTREAVLVGAAVQRLASDLLGRHVVDRAHELTVGGPLLGRTLGEAEVRQVAMLASPVAIEQDVARLDVAMDEPAPVGGVERVGDLLEDGNGPSRIQRALAAQKLLQVPARDEAHHDEQPGVLLARLVDRDHVGVVEAGGQP